MVVLFLRFYGPKPVLVYPFGLPLSTWFSGHISALRDTDGHKKSSRLLSVCDFVRNIESVQIACEASALPLSQAGVTPVLPILTKTASRQGTNLFAANGLILNDGARLRQR